MSLAKVHLNGQNAGQKKREGDTEIGRAVEKNLARYVATSTAIKKIPADEKATRQQNKIKSIKTKERRATTTRRTVLHYARHCSIPVPHALKASYLVVSLPFFFCIYTVVRLCVLVWQATYRGVVESRPTDNTNFNIQRCSLREDIVTAASTRNATTIQKIAIRRYRTTYRYY